MSPSSLRETTTIASWTLQVIKVAFLSIFDVFFSHDDDSFCSCLVLVENWHTELRVPEANHVCVSSCLCGNDELRWWICPQNKKVRQWGRNHWPRKGANLQQTVIMREENNNDNSTRYALCYSVLTVMLAVLFLFFSGIIILCVTKTKNTMTAPMMTTIITIICIVILFLYSFFKCVSFAVFFVWYCSLCMKSREEAWLSKTRNYSLKWYSFRLVLKTSMDFLRPLHVLLVFLVNILYFFLYSLRNLSQRRRTIL